MHGIFLPFCVFLIKVLHVMAKKKCPASGEKKTTTTTRKLYDSKGDFCENFQSLFKDQKIWDQIYNLSPVVILTLVRSISIFQDSLPYRRVFVGAKRNCQSINQSINQSNPAVVKDKKLVGWFMYGSNVLRLLRKFTIYLTLSLLRAVVCLFA